MIASKRQHRIARSKAKDFARALEEFDAAAAERIDLHPRLIRAERDAVQSQLADINDELEEYERLKSAPFSLR